MHKFTLIIIALVLSSTCFSEDANLLVEIRKDDSFERFLDSIDKAADRKDAHFIYSLVSNKFYLYRDFGGTYNEKATKVENFSWAFQLDNSKLREEYKDHGWKELKKALLVNSFEYSKFTSHEICGPSGALDKKYPEPQLCFTRNAEGMWLISSYINGGD